MAGGGCGSFVSEQAPRQREQDSPALGFLPRRRLAECLDPKVRLSGTLQCEIWLVFSLIRISDKVPLSVDRN